MIDEQLNLIIDNNERESNAVHRRVRRHLREKKWLGNYETRFAVPTEEQAASVGEVIEHYLWAGIRNSWGVKDDEKSFGSSLLVVFMGHVDWKNVGAHYFQQTRERHWYRVRDSIDNGRPLTSDDVI